MKKINSIFAIIIFLLAINVAAQAQPPKKILDQAKKITNEGDKFFRQRNYRMAVDRYQKASALLPDYSYPALYYNKGYAHYNLQEYSLALEALNKALAQGYTPIDIYKIRWYLNYQAKDYDAALKDAEEVVKVEPTNNNLLLAMGDIYREKGMYKDSIAAYEKASQLVPANGDVYYFTADSYARMGDTTQQGVVALKAVQNNTRYLGESWLLIANSFYTQKKISEAAEAYEKAISAKPQLTDGYVNLSEIYQNQNRLNDAIAITKKGIQANPTDGNLYINLTWLLSLTDRHVEAIGAGKKAIEYAPNEYMGYTNLCRAYTEVKEFETALQTCNKALGLRPGDGETNYYIGRIYSLQKKAETANSYYKKAVTGLIEFSKQRPDYADAYYLLGNSYLALEQIPSAIVAYKKCLELNPAFTKVLYNLGYAYILNNDKKSARVQYETLVKLDNKLAAKLLQDIQGN